VEAAPAVQVRLAEPCWVREEKRATRALPWSLSVSVAMEQRCLLMAWVVCAVSTASDPTHRHRTRWCSLSEVERSSKGWPWHQSRLANEFSHLSVQMPSHQQHHWSEQEELVGPFACCFATLHQPQRRVHLASRRHLQPHHLPHQQS
jgi:hypothetical protein